MTLFAIVAVCALCSRSTDGAPPRYVVYPLGSFGVVAISADGNVVGYTGTTSGVLWRDGRLIQLGTLGGKDCLPRGINDDNEIVGNSDLPSEQFVPFIWRSGVMKPLPVPPVAVFRDAIDINNKGQVLGELSLIFPGTGSAGFVLVGDQMTVFADVPPWGNEVRLRDINHHGQVVGSAFHQLFGDVAFIYQNGEMEILPELSSHPTAGAKAWGINDRGLIVGHANVVDQFSPTHAVIWEDGQIFDLGVADGYPASGAQAVNDNGVIVGYSVDGDFGLKDYRGCVWVDRVLYTLDQVTPHDPGWQFRIAWDINNAGQIVANAFHPEIGFRAVRLDPIAPADLDGDGAIDGIDLGTLLANWSIPPAAPGCGGDSPCYADINGDGLVNGIDLGILLANWTI